ncbi:MAG: protein kinase, partial [Gemmatimonadota bacterium]
ELGEGGMATVYLAKDIKHNRKVALKVLKPELAAVVGAERFLAEIETTANLQHPHILALFDSGEADGFLFFVMPFIEGETLADRIARDKQLPVDEALGIATSVANALHVAHEAGVVHRDIKPGNILLSRGEPLVADFGIALAVGAGGARLTETGLSVGTPFYMSPEQATGDQNIGPAADIYALACVLYEMLVGEPPYLGNTAQAVLGKIIQGLPVSATSARRSVPANVDAAIRKALEKLPADRFTTAGDFARTLSDPAFRYGDVEGVVSAGAARPRVARYAWPAVAILAVIAAVLGWLPSAAPGSSPVIRYKIQVPGYAAQVPMWFGALAPDGSAMVFLGLDATGRRTMYLKEARSTRAVPIESASQGFAGFSPDGRWLALAGFDGRLLKIDRTGGGSTVLAEVEPGSVVWTEDGTITVGANGKLVRVSEDGGVLGEIPLSKPTVTVGHLSPLPGDRGFLYVETGFDGGLSEQLWAYDARAGESKLLADGVAMAWYGEPGYLVMARSGAQASSGPPLFASAFDPESLELQGANVGLTEPVGLEITYTEMWLSPNGTAVYELASDTAIGGDRMVWVGRDGTETEVDPEYALEVETNGGMRLSPGGTHVAINTSEGSSASNIFVKRLPDGPPIKVTFTDEASRRPTWHPDGTTILFVAPGPSGHDALWQVRADGAGSAQLVLERERAIFEGLWSPDGEWLVYRTDDEGTPDRGDIMAIRPGVDSVPTPIAATAAEETGPALSPDGRWIAFASNEQGGRKEVFVRPFPNVDDGRWQISTNGGTEPAWSPDGSEIFFWSGLAQLEMGAAQVETTGGFALQSVETLFRPTVTYRANDDSRWYDVHPDGDRFLMVRRAYGAEDQPLVLVENFFELVAEALGR